MSADGGCRDSVLMVAYMCLAVRWRDAKCVRRRSMGMAAIRATCRIGFFFFQAEDGIRDVAVTGVQTCALPIFIAGKEMRAIPANRSAGGRPKIVPFEWRLGHAGGVEKVPGVHRAIAEEIKKLTVEFVGARARGDVDDGSGVSAVFSAVRGVVDFELGYRVDGRLEGDLILNHITEVDAVHQEVDGVFPLSCGVKANDPWPRRGAVKN